MTYQPLMVAIAGPSNCGKSTLEAGLQDRFENAISFISFDDFFVGLDALPGRTTDNWEHPDLYRWDEYERVLGDLKQSRKASFAPHSYEAKRDGVRERTIMPSRIITTTGFLALHSPEINKLFDLRIYIDIPADEMVRRRLARAAERPSGAWNDLKYIEEMLIPATREFVEPQKEESYFEISGTQPPEQVLNMVATLIDSFYNWKRN